MIGGRSLRRTARDDRVQGAVIGAGRTESGAGGVERRGEDQGRNQHGPKTREPRGAIVAPGETLLAHRGERRAADEKPAEHEEDDHAFMAEAAEREQQQLARPALLRLGIGDDQQRARMADDHAERAEPAQHVEMLETITRLIHRRSCRKHVKGITLSRGPSWPGLSRLEERAFRLALSSPSSAHTAIASHPCD
ncbi:hypothetical protein Ms3S1_05870 [Methylosinus sp. 3S-1]|nr:hypothetical protein A8B73_02195 [Methylosinus sp. 3S-1]